VQSGWQTDWGWSSPCESAASALFTASDHHSSPGGQRGRLETSEVLVPESQEFGPVQGFRWIAHAREGRWAPKDPVEAVGHTECVGSAIPRRNRAPRACKHTDLPGRVTETYGGPSLMGAPETADWARSAVVRLLLEPTWCRIWSKRRDASGSLG
jgi:hypothetical protein